MTQKLLSVQIAFISNIRVTVPAPNILAADVFGTGIFDWHFVPYNRYSPHTLGLPLPTPFPHFLARHVSRYGNWTVSADVHEAESARLNEVHRSFQEWGSSVRSFLHVIPLAPTIWIWPSVLLKKKLHDSVCSNVFLGYWNFIPPFSSQKSSESPSLPWRKYQLRNGTSFFCQRSFKNNGLRRPPYYLGSHVCTSCTIQICLSFKIK